MTTNHFQHWYQSLQLPSFWSLGLLNEFLSRYGNNIPFMLAEYSRANMKTFAFLSISFRDEQNLYFDLLLSRYPLKTDFMERCLWVYLLFFCVKILGKNGKYWRKLEKIGKILRKNWKYCEKWKILGENGIYWEIIFWEKLENIDEKWKILGKFLGKIGKY